MWIIFIIIIKLTIELNKYKYKMMSVEEAGDLLNTALDGKNKEEAVSM